MGLEKKRDVVIVGGGPAGLSAAIILAQAGHDITLYEKQFFPIDKPCGEGIMPYGVEHLRRLGVLDLIDKTQRHPFFGIRYMTKNGAVAQGMFRRGFGLGVRRTALSAALVERVRGLGNVRIIEGCAVDCENPPTPFSKGGIIVGADGLNSRVRKWAGIEGKIGRLRRYGIRRHYEVKPWTDRVEIYFDGKVEAYVTPSGEEQVGVAFLWRKQKLDENGGKEELVDAMLARFPLLASKLAGCKAISKPMAIGPLERIVKTPIAGNVILIGDASGYLDPITGEGVSLALAQSAALANSTKGISHLLNTFTKIKRPYQRLTNLVLFLSDNPRLCDATIHALSRMPKLFDWILSTYGETRKV